MNIKKNRDQLKEQFKKNKIIREQDFSDLFDASVNQTSDGVHKSINSPLTLEVRKTIYDDPEHPEAKLDNHSVVLFFEEIGRASEPLYSFSMDKGFSINKGRNESRLFISHEDESRGYVGVGTTDPKEKLHIVGNALISDESSHSVLRINGNSIDSEATNSSHQDLHLQKNGGDTVVGGNLIIHGKIINQQDGWHDADFKMVNSEGETVNTIWRNYNDFLGPEETHAYNTTGYFKDHMGFVHLRGLVRRSTSLDKRSVIFTLPEGYRPARNEIHAPISSDRTKATDHDGWGEQTRVDIYPNGEVTIVVGLGVWVSLDGISFYANQEIFNEGDPTPEEGPSPDSTISDGGPGIADEGPRDGSEPEVLVSE